MSLVVELENGAVRVHGEPVPRPTPIPAKPHNDGDGDVRKGIVPNIKPPAGPSATAWEGGAYVSLQQFLDGPSVGAAILLQPADDIRALQGRLDAISLIAVDFPRIGDGRGYTHAFLLRNRLNYQGRLRALGAVTADQVSQLARVGFNSFALRADQDAAPAVAALRTFTVPYQGRAVAGTKAERAEANFTARVRLLERALTAAADKHERIALASSLSAEDMVITDAIARLKLPVTVFTLDTGRLNPETLALIGEIKAKYGIEVEVHHPDDRAVKSYVATCGLDGFYEGVAQRKLCCEIRKVAPLEKALKGRDAWITGQRRDQATTRAALRETERDAARGVAKYNPLAAWTWGDVLAYAERFGIPMNALYARGYVSIGCEPCTKAVRPGEDPRNGRWWWENQDNKECGLHTS